MAASVLLNFANSVDFTPTDPLIGMVRTGASLLSYDLLSVNTFSKKDDERRIQIRSKLAELRNMLENRRLSSEDQNERIRLIIILDFNPWEFLKPEIDTDSFDAAFPILKIDYVKSVIQDVWGPQNLLLRRFDFAFIFIDDLPDENYSIRYKLAAYHGFCKTGHSKTWLSADCFQLNKHRDETLEKMGKPYSGMLLTDSSISSAYNEFLKQKQIVFGVIKNWLKKIGKDDEFDEFARDRFNPRTVEEFQKKDFDYILQTIVTNCAGLGAERFRDCTFFIMNMRQSVVSSRYKDLIALKSLIQLLCTINDEDFKSLLRPVDDNDFHKLFIMAEPSDRHINTDALLQYQHDLSVLGAIIGGPDWCNSEGKLTGLSWEPSKEVQYHVYLPKNVNAEGSHESSNDAINRESSEKEKWFKKVRRVPFFFGKYPNDWHWYQQVTQAIISCLSFEDNNNRPLIESLTRVDDTELPKETRTVTYGELELLIEHASAADIVSTVDYDNYIINRKKKIDELGDKAEKMKKELIKLGVRSRFLLIAFLFCLAFALCFAFHFFYSGSEDHPLWISAGISVFLLSIIIGMIIAQYIIKNKINDIYREIDSIFEDLRKLAKDHLQSVNRLVTEMNKADANRKTLTEMKAKYSEWKKRNKKVENWVKYIRDMKSLLDDILRFLMISRNKQDESSNDKTMIINDSILESKPSIIAKIRSKEIYNDMHPKVIVTNQNKENTIKDVTCFLSQFDFMCIQK